MTLVLDKGPATANIMDVYVCITDCSECDLLNNQLSLLYYNMTDLKISLA